MSVKRTIIDALEKTPAGHDWLGLLDLRKRYLTPLGWTRSSASRTPVDEQGAPIPWFSYASIFFLKDRLTKDMSVFEYGSGNSTLWFSQRVGEVVSLEHDVAWYERMKRSLEKLEGVTYIYRDLDSGDYAAEVTKHKAAFDIIIVDGRQRVLCAKNSVAALTERGVIIWDNAEREVYQEGYEHLLSLGFRRLDFNSLGPINRYASTTAIFYKPGNCLGI